MMAVQDSGIIGGIASGTVNGEPAAARHATSALDLPAELMWRRGRAPLRATSRPDRRLDR
jgi:hypothetical protein